MLHDCMMQARWPPCKLALKQIMQSLPNSQQALVACCLRLIATNCQVDRLVTVAVLWSISYAKVYGRTYCTGRSCRVSKRALGSCTVGTSCSFHHKRHKPNRTWGQRLISWAISKCLASPPRQDVLGHGERHAHQQ